MDKREYHKKMGNYFDLMMYYVSGKIVTPMQLEIKKEGDRLMQLSEAEKNIIGILDCKGDQKIGDLAAFSKLSYTNMSKFVDRIEREGYVRRYTDPDCRGNVYVCITEEGKKLHQEFLDKIYGKAEEKFDELYSDEEQTEVMELFEKLLEKLRRFDEPQNKGE